MPITTAHTPVPVAEAATGAVSWGAGGWAGAGGPVNVSGATGMGVSSRDGATNATPAASVGASTLASAPTDRACRAEKEDGDDAHPDRSAHDVSSTTPARPQNRPETGAPTPLDTERGVRRREATVLPVTFAVSMVSLRMLRSTPATRVRS